MKEHKQPFEPAYIIYECFHFEEGERIVEAIQQMSNPPTALLVTSDQVAAGILTCCKEQNILIPEKLAIMGFDNQPIAKIMNITTLDIPLVEIGKKLFMQAIDERNFTHEEIKVKLIERMTV